MKKHRCVIILFSMSVCFLLASCGVEQNAETVYQEQSIVEESAATLSEPESAATVETESIEESVPSDSETEGEGVSVYVSQNSYEESSAWYSDVEAFLQDFGFADREPFYEYYDSDGNPLMTLYFDEQTEEGCGIRYYAYRSDMFSRGGIYGFTFQGVDENEWEGVAIEDYMATTSVFGDNGSQYVKDYTENREYNEAGQLSHFDARGILPDMEILEPIGILGMDFTYHENGRLKTRDYWHNSLVFPTSSMTLQSYFDEQGRLLYEDEYITHGSLDYYYIYEGDSSIPEYCLVLDFMHSAWMPQFIKYSNS